MQENAFVYNISLNQPKVCSGLVDDHGSSRSDYQGEDNTQTHCVMDCH